MGEGLFAGRYELLGMLGHGGMARVQRARDTRMGRIVAVKTLLPELADNPDARRRFAREAQAAGALNHPGIVTVHDQDEVEDGDQVVPYLVMEYVSGRTLAQLVRERASFEPEEAVRIVCDILDALAHAHSRGTVHRDVKPANVMITDEGTVKVADFGIARVLDSDQRLTATGSAIGTPSYMSPEQINGGDVDARSDVYAAGCVLVELLTGRPPFTDGNPINLMYWHVHTPPPEPSARNPRVPRELDALVLQALAKDPASRPADAAVFRNRLRGWLSGVAAAGSSAVPDPSADAAPAAAATSAPLVKDAAPAAPTAAPAADAPAHRADPRATYGLGGQLPVLPGAAPRQPAGAPGGPAPRTPGQFPPHIPAQGVRDATPPPPAQPQHPAYGQAAPHTPPSLTPPPPAYLPAPAPRRRTRATAPPRCAAAAGAAGPRPARASRWPPWASPWPWSTGRWAAARRTPIRPAPRPARPPPCATRRSPCTAERRAAATAAASTASCARRAPRAAPSGWPPPTRR
ncbi:protein kinase [Actinacidiphila sp. DG2A-62]|uniref:protein kinase domain-containing protein n=1 Tax=Actinacidiphila sp. DG2A-62 TaxID=3108821 RepID=UPI002DB651E7|nr:protein kinase [Actinacidiphila sp. DG2A-62]MEC3993380.1 protein kinase [Actinacidiphila sp. DG2A-62]